MTRPVYMNGADYMMSVFDLQLKRLGGAGNLSHLVAGLPAAPDEAVLRARLAEAGRAFPMLAARQRRGIFSGLPYWQLPRGGAGRAPVVRTVRADAAQGQTLDTLRTDVFNTTLDAGELLRFTVIEAAGRTELITTWSHALMDARGAEILLAWIGQVPAPAVPPDVSDTHTRRAYPRIGLRHDLRLAWQALRRLDQMRDPPPLSLFTARAGRTAVPRQTALFLSFSAAETAAIRESVTERCGFLGETTYYLAATLVELNRFCRAAGIPAESYVVNIPASARAKGSNAPIFSNLSSFMTHYLRRSDVGGMEGAVQAIQSQTRAALASGFGAAFDSFGTFVRRMPPGLYWDRMRIALNGELASLFFANTGSASPDLDRFLGQEVLYLRHATSVTCPPGLGVFFHTFRGQLCCTVALIEGLLAPEEQAALVASLRLRLLTPGAEGGTP